MENGSHEVENKNEEYQERKTRNIVRRGKKRKGVKQRKRETSG